MNIIHYILLSFYFHIVFINMVSCYDFDSCSFYYILRFILIGNHLTILIDLIIILIILVILDHCLVILVILIILDILNLDYFLYFNNFYFDFYSCSLINYELIIKYKKYIIILLSISTILLWHLLIHHSILLHHLLLHIRIHHLIHHLFLIHFRCHLTTRNFFFGFQKLSSSFLTLKWRDIYFFILIQCLYFLIMWS